MARDYCKKGAGRPAKKYEPTGNPVGRPSKYGEDKLRIARGFALLGRTNEQIAEELGINQNTFYQWLNKFPEFCEAIEQARKLLDLDAVNSLHRKINGFSLKRCETIEIVDDSGNIKSIQKKVEVKEIAPCSSCIQFHLSKRVSEYMDHDTKDTQAEILSLLDGMNEQQEQICPED